MEIFVKKLKEVWFIILAIVALVIWYANTNSRLSAVEAKVIEQQTALQKLDQVQIDLAVVKANVEFIKNNLNK